MGGGVFWKGVVDYGSVAHSSRSKGSISGKEGQIQGVSHTVVEKRSRFWEGGVDYRRVAVNVEKGVYSGREC